MDLSPGPRSYFPVPFMPGNFGYQTLNFMLLDARFCFLLLSFLFSFFFFKVLDFLLAHC